MTVTKQVIEYDKIKFTKICNTLDTTLTSMSVCITVTAYNKNVWHWTHYIKTTLHVVKENTAITD